MSIEGKYGTVITEFGSIGQDEPVFLLRARDALAVKTISDYWIRAIDAGCSQGFQDSLSGVMETFLAWQEENETKVPD